MISAPHCQQHPVGYRARPPRSVHPDREQVGDLIGRKQAYVLGLLAYAIGALAMTLAQGVTAIVRLLAADRWTRRVAPAPLDAIPHPRQLRGSGPEAVYALARCPRPRIAAAVGPLLGGFITTFRSWRVGFLLEAAIIGVVLSGLGRVRDVPYTWTPFDTSMLSGRSSPLSVLGRTRPGASSCGRKAGSPSWRSWRSERFHRDRSVTGSSTARTGSRAHRPRPFPIEFVQARDHRTTASADRAPRDDDRYSPDLPADGSRVQRDADGPVDSAPLALACSRVSAARRQEGGRTGAPSSIDPVGLRAPVDRAWRMLIRDRASRRFRLVASPRPVGGRWLGAGPSSCPSSITTRCPRIDEERVSEAAGV